MYVFMYVCVQQFNNMHVASIQVIDEQKNVYSRDDLPLLVFFSMVIELVQDRDVFAILYMTRVIDICVPQDCCFAGV